MRPTIRGVLYAACSAALLLTVPTPVAAQFDPAFNHLKCYRIKGGPRVEKVFLAENQFGRERIVKLTPLFLCAPTRKICCSNPASVPGCDQVPCPADPTPHQPAAVDHFKCYKIGVKFCDQTSVDCTTLAKAPKGIQATLINQFGTENVLIGPAKMLCTPVLKQLVGQTTTTTTTPTTTVQTTSTTSTTTTTRPPCRLEAFPLGPGMCAGDCPNPTDVCLNVPAGSNTCECVPQDQRCELGQPGACNGFCPGQAEVCQATPPAGACDCCNLPGAPCAAHADCCSGSCLPSSTCN